MYCAVFILHEHISKAQAPSLTSREPQAMENLKNIAMTYPIQFVAE